MRTDRLPSYLPAADALYDSSRVAHSSRWQLPLPPGLLTTHHRTPLASDAESLTLQLPAGPWQTGWAGAGFAFDNELTSHSVALAACNIDSEAVSWQRYLPFVDAGGYRDLRWWSAPGWQWHTLDLHTSAVHLSYFEAQAWCQWSQRALPSEAQWERAAVAHPGFQWGQVWEWTANSFAPYHGFVAHPYRDYSAPWFDGRPVLKGASAATRARMAHPRYRNYFEPHRNDVPAGFRTCKI